MFTTKDKKALVVQSNQLIEQPFRLTSKEHLLVRWFISKIQKDDTNFQVYRLKISDYMRLIGIKSGSEYKYIKEITKGLSNKGFSIKTDKGELQLNWFASAEYIDNEGIVEIEFSSKLKPYLIQLKECYTSSPFGFYTDMKCQYSFNLFDLLNRFMNSTNKTRYFTIDDFRQKLSIEEHEYSLYADLKKRVINPAIEEINKYTYMIVDYKEDKVGRKVVGLNFTFYKKEEVIEVKNNCLYEELITEISNKSNGIIILNIKMIQKILQVKGKEKLQYYINNLDSLDYEKADKPTGFFIDAVMNEYKLISRVSKNSNRNNFEQREYDDEYFDNFFPNQKGV